LINSVAEITSEIFPVSPVRPEFGDVFGNRPPDVEIERIGDKAQNERVNAVIFVAERLYDVRRGDKTEGKRQEPGRKPVDTAARNAFAGLCPLFTHLFFLQNSRDSPPTRFPPPFSH
jgi:hypothetical protein